MARREKLYWPPLRGMAAPSSAIEDAPNKAYRPPITQTPRKNQGFGRICAMTPGVRTIPAAMVLPTAAAMPNHTPRTCNNFPVEILFRGGAGPATRAGLGGASGMLGKLFSPGVRGPWP